LPRTRWPIFIQSPLFTQIMEVAEIHIFLRMMEDSDHSTEQVMEKVHILINWDSILKWHTSLKQHAKEVLMTKQVWEKMIFLVLKIITIKDLNVNWASSIPISLWWTNDSANLKQKSPYKLKTVVFSVTLHPRCNLSTNKFSTRH